MARHKLENELIAIEVEEHGAELKSLVRKNTGKEYMWKADPKFWGRTSPVLFPFVGAVKDKQFRTKGQTYTMGQHGFARDMDFTLDSQTEDTLWFVLKSNEETMAKYPYAFTLRIGYHIEEIAGSALAGGKSFGGRTSVFDWRASGIQSSEKL